MLGWGFICYTPHTTITYHIPPTIYHFHRHGTHSLMLGWGRAPAAAAAAAAVRRLLSVLLRRCIPPGPCCRCCCGVASCCGFADGWPTWVHESSDV